MISYNKSALALLLSALFLSGCENGNNIHGDNETTPPVEPPEETVLIESVSFSGQFTPNSKVSMSFECSGCDLDATTTKWVVTKRSEPLYNRESTSRTLEISEVEADAQISLTISPVDQDGKKQEDVVKTFDLETKKGFDEAKFFHFGKDGYVIRLNEDTFLSSQNAETMAPKHVYLVNKDDPSLKDFAIDMPSIDEPSGSFMRKELYEFPNKRWGIAVNANGESQELTEFEGGEYVLDCGTEYFTYKGTTISRFDESNLGTPVHTYDAGTLDEVNAYCGHGVVFEKIGNTAVYFPKKGDPRPETEVELTDISPNTFFTNQAFSGYLTPTGELKLLGESLPPLAFSKTGAKKVYNNISANEITVEFDDGTFYRVGDFGAKYIEVVSAADATTVKDVNTQAPSKPTDLNLVDFLYLDNGSILTSSELAEDGFYDPLTNKSCSEWINESANGGSIKGVNLTVAAGNNSLPVMATDRNGYLYACNPNKASVNIDDKLTEQSIDGNYTQIKQSKGTNEVYLLDQGANKIAAYTVSIDADGKPIVSPYSLDNIDDQIDMLGFSAQNNGSNISVVRADGTQLILGSIAGVTGDKSILFSGYETWNHLNTLCSDSQCMSVHSNEAGDVDIAVINNKNSVIKYNYEGLVKREAEEAEPESGASN
ncbi:hypothetical protein DZF79_13925 [Vibrio parahaemolyticus]|nr:hypothetical protein [Vibrio parahaemolyticus]